MPSLLQQSKKIRRLVLWHCAGWLLYTLYDNLYTILFAGELRSQGALQGILITGIYDLCVSLFTFYSLVYCLLWFVKGNRSAAVTGILLVLGLTYWLSYVYIDWFTALHILDPIPENQMTRNLILSTLRFFILFFGYAMVYVLAVTMSRKQSQIYALQWEKQKMEDERKEKELQTAQLQNAFLRSQINPHFLYNTLNFFYARALSYSDELAEGILTLSDIMRYSLQSQEGQTDEVPLLQEINHIENVIKINRLRYKNNLFIDFVVKGNPADVRIVPLALITLVENVLKHGEINNPQHPATILLTIAETNVQLYCHNKKKTGMKEPGTGIGIENTRERLRRVYGNRSSIRTSEDAAFFTTCMTISYH